MVLTLVFGFLVVPTGNINHSAVFTEVIHTIEQYKSVLIVDDSENPRTLANITVLEEYSFINNEQEITEDFTPYLETLMGIEITDSKLKIRTHTGGCTTEDSFEISINKGFTGLPPYILEVYRIEPDYCKGYFPDGILLEYDLATLGLEPFATFSLTNKIRNLK